MTKAEITLRDKIISQIKNVRKQLAETTDCEERKAILEELCILYARLQAAIAR